MIAQRKVSRLVAVIVIGSLFGGAAGFYIRENIQIKERENMLGDLTQLVEEKKERIQDLKSTIERTK